MGKANVFDPEFDADRVGPVFTWRGATLGAQAGAERLGATLYELPPGEAPWPIHYHLNNEEMLIVLRGRPSLRTTDGERELDEGAVIARPVGADGAFQLVNRTDDPVRLLIVSEMRVPDVVVRPESGKLSVFGRAPGSGGEGMHLVFREADRVGFWEDEQPPPPKVMTVKSANVFDPEFDPPTDRPGFTYRRARIGRQAGAERLGASLFELPPGEATFPYHFQLANEEMIVVLRGTPHLRTPDGWRRLDEGELVACPVGERGGHQIHNRTDEPVRVLVISEMNAPELSFYPDSGKVLAGDRAPGAASTEHDLLFDTFRTEDAVDYWDGESPPSEQR